MLAIYVDESGMPDTKTLSAHFVVAGLAIPLDSWKMRDAELQRILENHRLGGVEMHTAWMARYYPEQNRIPDFDKYSDADRRHLVMIERKKDIAKASLGKDASVKSLKKNYKKTESYIHLTHAERLQTLREVADAIGSWQEARLFGEARSTTLLPDSKNAIAREQALEQITTRFELCLRNRFGSSGLGIMIHDQNQAASVKLTSLFRAWQSSGTSYAGIDHIVETPLFVDSSLTAMIQAADLAAYATRRFFEKNETDLFDRIYSRFDRTGALMVGLRHYTGTHPCSCRVCQDHGRQ